MCTKGVRSNGINFGGWLDYDWGRAIFVPAFHSSSNLEGQYMGEPAGVILEISDVKFIMPAILVYLVT